MAGPSSTLVRQDGRQFIPGKFDALDRQAVAPLLFPGSQIREPHRQMPYERGGPGDIRFAGRCFDVLDRYHITVPAKRGTRLQGQE